MKKTIFQTSRLVCLSLLSFLILFSAFKSPNNDETMKASAFRTYTGIVTFFSQDFDFDIKCSIQSYEMVYQGRQQDPVALQNKGGNFSPDLMKLVKAAKAGDTFIFREIRARCHGDLAARALPSLVVMVK